MKTEPSRRSVRVLAAAAVMLLTAGAASAQSLCDIYTVKPGDSLSKIARTAGVAGGYQLVFNANQDVLTSPNLIEVGQKLKIPCADGSLPVAGGGAAEPVAATAEPAATETATTEPAATETATTEPVATEPAATATAAVAPTTDPAPKEERGPIRFLTGGAYAPFTDEELPEQGLFTELVKTALHNGDPEQTFKVTFVNDWGPHLTDLLPSGAFDMGFPWYRPDCERLENLRPANRLRCTDYNHSDPFFEAVVSFYALKGSSYEKVQTHDKLFGARLCRPRGWFTFDLEAEKLVEPNVTMLVAPTQLDCWRALQEGEVDIVTFDALPAEDDIASLGIADAVVELPPLATLATLHVFAPKTSERGLEDLATLNKGLAMMRENGQWFEIVSRHLSAHAKKKASN